jgi:hypothetical protein
MLFVQLLNDLTIFIWLLFDSTLCSVSGGINTFSADSDALSAYKRLGALRATLGKLNIRHLREDSTLLFQF